MPYPRKKSMHINLTTFYDNQVTNVLGVKQGVIPLIEHEKNEIPCGTIMASISPIIKEGFLECKGQTLIRSMYPGLFNLIGTTYGGDGITTFRLMDLRGAFIRGHGQNESYPTYSGTNLQEYQTHASETHSHIITDPTHSHNFMTRNDDYNSSGSYTTFTKPSVPQYDSVENIVNWSSAVGNSATNISINKSLTSASADANETRPFNYSVVWIIKT